MPVLTNSLGVTAFTIENATVQPLLYGVCSYLASPTDVELSLCRHKYVTSSACSGFGGAPLVAVLVVYYKLRTMTATVREYYIQLFLSIRTRAEVEAPQTAGSDPV
jgi:hypothetical protein